MRCHEIRDYLQDYLDNEVPYSIKQVIDEHVVECVTCHDYLESFRKLNAILQLRSVPDPGETYWPSTWKLIKSQLPARRIALNEKVAAPSHPKTFGIPFYRMRLAFAATLLFAFIGLGSYLFYRASQKAPLIISRDTEYILMHDDLANQEILISQPIPTELQPDFAFAAFSRVALGGFDPVSKGVGFAKMEAATK